MNQQTTSSQILHCMHLTLSPNGPFSPMNPFTPLAPCKMKKNQSHQLFPATDSCLLWAGL